MPVGIVFGSYLALLARGSDPPETPRWLGERTP
jgi:hypothetical protein